LYERVRAKSSDFKNNGHPDGLSGIKNFKDKTDKLIFPQLKTGGEV